MDPSFTSTSLYNFTFQLPSPNYITLDDGLIFNELLQQEHLFSVDHSNHNANNISVHQQLASPDIRASLQLATGKGSNNNNGDDGFKKPKTSTKRRRASKKEINNKVNTAQGPRDRRMRLSIEVSRKFFKLQDMLGFDKASKTVEWLLMKSKSNIQELIPHGKSSFLDGLLSEYIDGDQSAKSSSNSNRKGKKKTSRVRKSSYLLRPFAKETREMARKRARERTLEKNSKLACVSGDDDQFPKFKPCLDLTMDQGVNSFGPWIINQPEQALQNKGVSPTIGISGWNPSFLYNYQHSGVHPQEMHQFSNFQIHGNLWEFNN